VTSLDPPLDDFRSGLGWGEIPRPGRDGRFDPEILRRAAGVSCFATRDQALALAIRLPELGQFIAELFIPDDDCKIEVARTFRTEGHYTVWASPAYFVSRIVSVMPL
jgi:hypothetical protein